MTNLGWYTRALLVSQDRRHLFVTPYIVLYLEDQSMDEGTLKTQIPSLLVIYVWGGEAILYPAEYGPQYCTFQHPPPPQSAYTVHWEWGEGGGGQREGTVEGQQHTSIVP